MSLKLRRRPKVGQFVTLWGKDHRITGVNPLRTCLDVRPADGSPVGFRISVFQVRKAQREGLRTEGAPSIELKLRSEAATQGASCPPKTEPETPWDWMLLDRTNARAFSQWNVGRQNPRLPPAPDGSGCSYHYCWMPCVRNDGEGGQFCAAHGGKDAPLPPWPLRDMRDRTADALADEVDLLVRNKVIDSRSPTADALLDYRNNPRTPRSDRLRSLEQEVVRLGEWVDELTDHSPPAEPAPATLRQLLQKTLRRGGGALLPLSARPARVAEVLRLTILRQQRMSGRWKALAKRFKEELAIATTHASKYLRELHSQLPCGHKVSDLVEVTDSTYRCAGCAVQRYLPVNPDLKP